MSEDRQREGQYRPTATAIAWFQLYEKMPVSGGALAYPAKWNAETQNWRADTSATKIRIYQSPVSLVGYALDFVGCVYMARSRRWEMIARMEDWGWARLSGDLAALGSATARIWSDTSISNTMVDMGVDITVHDRLLPAGETISTLTRIRWEYNPRTAKRYVVDSTCDPDVSSTVWGE